MEKNLTYHHEGDYLIPNLIPPDNPHIGVCGLRRKDYLLKSKKPIYTGMLLSGKLNVHLEEIDRSASEMFSQLVDEMAKREDITETLKAENQMECGNPPGTKTSETLTRFVNNTNPSLKCSSDIPNSSKSS